METSNALSAIRIQGMESVGCRGREWMVVPGGFWNGNRHVCYEKLFALCDLEESRDCEKLDNRRVRMRSF